MKTISTLLRFTIAVNLLTISVQAQPVVTYPNGGETLTVGSSVNITWSGTALNTVVGIDYTIDNWANTIWLNTSYQNPAANSYTWVVPNTPGTQCKVGVFNTSFDGDISDNTFSIIPATGNIDEGKAAFSPISVFPNPSKGVMSVINPFHAPLNLSVYDILGKMQNVVFQNDGKGTYTLAQGMLQSGTYILVIKDESDGKFIRRKFQVE